MKVGVFRIPLAAPDDISGLDALVQSKELDPGTIVAILAKTEGNGCVNDFTRGFCVASIKSYLQSQGLSKDLLDKIVFCMSGGTEGVISPHLTVFTRKDEDVIADASDDTTPTPDWGLVVGVHQTRPILPEELGTVQMVQLVADGVQQALASARLEAEHTHWVQIKCPLLTNNSSSTTSNNTKHMDSYQSMALSRGAAALGVAVALGEVSIQDLSDEDICSNYTLYSQVASTSAGVELQHCEIVVMGNAADSQSDYTIGHAVMQHALDVDAVKQALSSAGTTLAAVQAAAASGTLSPVVNCFCKAEAAGTVLGCRTTMLDDSDISHTRVARAVVGATVASVLQDPLIYVSGGAEHQGPVGGGPIAVICRK